MILEYQYDSYEDEYDDTYDYSDIKLNATAELDQLLEKTKLHPINPIEIHESKLVDILLNNPSFFSTKNSPERIKFIKETGLTNQQIQGWASYLERNPSKKQNILEKYEWKGNEPIQVYTEMEISTGRKRHDRKKRHAQKLQKGMGGKEG